MTSMIALLIAIWLCGVVALIAFGYRAGLRSGFFHVRPLVNLLGWPLALPYWIVRRDDHNR